MSHLYVTSIHKKVTRVFSRITNKKDKKSYITN